MLNGRIYRAALLPVAAALAVVGMSLGDRPAALSPALAPASFEGGWAERELATLARRFPDRPPGGSDDRALAAYIARFLGSLGGPDAAGFRVSEHRFEGQTVDGSGRLVDVVAVRAGSTTESPIVIVAHRDASRPGALGELSGTAVLLELARILVGQETRRPIVLASTSGGSGGAAGASELVSLLRQGSLVVGSRTGPAEAGATEAAAASPADAVIVLGDLAERRTRRPVVVPYSSAVGSAPSQLYDTAAAAVGTDGGIPPGAPSVIDQLAHLAAPLSVSEQAPFDAAGLPAVLLQTSGEASRAGPLSASRMEAMGSAALGTIDALDAGPDIAAAPQAELLISQRVLPGWAARLLVGVLLAPALLVALDALARLRRRREPVARWIGLPLACAVPFLLAALVMDAIGSLTGAIPALPAAAGAPTANAAAVIAVALGFAAFAAAWWAWPRLVAALDVAESPRSAAAGLGMLLVLDAAAFLTWIANPFAALLLVPAAHLWLIVAAPELRPRRRRTAIAVVLLGVCGPVLVVAYYAHQLGTGAPGGLWAALLLVAGGHVAIGTLVLWSVSLGCLVAAALVALARRAPNRALEQVPVTIRGPITYAGPGSLGGTESALRR